MVYDSPHKLDRATLKAEGARASDPPQGGDAVGLARFEAGYAVKDGGEMGRVKPAPKARTMTNGRFPEATRIWAEPVLDDRFPVNLQGSFLARSTHSPQERVAEAKWLVWSGVVSHVWFKSADSRCRRLSGSRRSTCAHLRGLLIVQGRTAVRAGRAPVQVIPRRGARLARPFGTNALQRRFEARFAHVESAGVQLCQHVVTRKPVVEQPLNVIEDVAQPSDLRTLVAAIGE
ncbi:Uncharacterised protein [Burkholderia pseudomallei]|nr:Uncharacterised protein [Burkholderia pseudomallei]